MGDHQRFPGVKQPVYAWDNVHAAGAHPSDGERDPLVLEGEAAVKVLDEGGEVYLQVQFPEGFDGARVPVVTGRDFERVRFADADFEERDGTAVVVDTDLVGVRKEPGQAYPAGPLAALRAGTTRVRVW
jgi:hypothetical protein